MKRTTVDIRRPRSYSHEEGTFIISVRKHLFNVYYYGFEYEYT